MGKINIDLGGLFGEFFGDKTAQTNPNFDPNLQIDPLTGLPYNPDKGISYQDANGKSDVDYKNPYVTPSWATKAFHPEIAQQEQNQNNSWNMAPAIAARNNQIENQIGGQNADLSKATSEQSWVDRHGAGLFRATGGNPSARNQLDVEQQHQNLLNDLPSLSAEDTNLGLNNDITQKQISGDIGVPSANAYGDLHSSEARAASGIKSATTDTANMPVIQPLASANLSRANLEKAAAEQAVVDQPLSLQAQHLGVAAGLNTTKAQLAASDLQKQQEEQRLGMAPTILSANKNEILTAARSASHPPVESNILFQDPVTGGVYSNPNAMSQSQQMMAGMKYKSPTIDVPRTPDGRPISLPSLSQNNDKTITPPLSQQPTAKSPYDYEGSPISDMLGGIKHKVNSTVAGAKSLMSGEENTPTPGKITSDPKTGDTIYTDEKNQHHVVHTGTTTGGRVYHYYKDPDSGRNIVLPLSATGEQ